MAKKPRKKAKVPAVTKRRQLDEAIHREQIRRVQKYVVAYEALNKKFKCQMVAKPKFVPMENGTWQIETGLMPIPMD